MSITYVSFKYIDVLQKLYIVCDLPYICQKRQEKKMSERDIELDWEQAEEDSLGQMLFIFPEGTTNFKIAKGTNLRRGSFKGKYIISIIVDNKIREASLGAKLVNQIAKSMKNGKSDFSLMRIGEGLKTQYKLLAQEGIKKK